MEYDTVQMKVTQMQIKLTKMCKIISSYENYTLYNATCNIVNFFIPRNKTPISNYLMKVYLELKFVEIGCFFTCSWIV